MVKRAIGLYIPAKLYRDIETERTKHEYPITKTQMFTMLLKIGWRYYKNGERE